MRMVLNVGFQDLQPAREDVAGDLLKRNVELVLTKPPYKVRSERSMNNSLHDIFTSEARATFWSWRVK